MTSDYYQALGPFASNTTSPCGSPATSHLVPVVGHNDATIAINFDLSNVPNRLVGRLVVGAAGQSLYGRVVMDSKNARVVLDRASARLTSVGKPQTLELQAENRSITIQRIGNFYTLGPDLPKDVVVSFRPGAVKIDGRNVNVPSVRFQRTKATYRYVPHWGVC